jgi:hypothetical protein
MAAEGGGRSRRIGRSASTQEPGGTGQSPASRRRPARRRSAEPLDVRIEFVVLDGDAGKALARRQATVIRQALQWFHDHPAAVAQDASGTDQTV